MFTGYRAARRRRLNPLTRRFYESAYSYIIHSLRRRNAGQKAADFLDEKLGHTVGFGEFAGLNFRAGRSIANQYHSKLLGTYEKELSPVWHAIRAVNYDLIVNVGAADGLYAVGLSKMHPEAPAIAFEADDRYQNSIKQLASDNGVKLEIRGYCTPAGLAECFRSSKRPLALVDVEGFEFTLLDQNTIPSLGGCDILLETHEFLDIPGNDEMMRRFSPTHDIEIIRAKRRRLSDLPFDPPHDQALRLDLVTLLQEHRSYPQEWLWMRSRMPTAAIADPTYRWP